MQWRRALLSNGPPANVKHTHRARPTVDCGSTRPWLPVSARFARPAARVVPRGVRSGFRTRQNNQERPLQRGFLVLLFRARAKKRGRAHERLARFPRTRDGARPPRPTQTPPRGPRPRTRPRAAPRRRPRVRAPFLVKIRCQKEKSHAALFLSWPISWLQVKLQAKVADPAPAAASGGGAPNATYAALERERTFASAPDPIRSVLQHSKSHPRMLESACASPSPSPPAPPLTLFFLPPKSRVRSARPPPLAPMC